MSDWTGLLAQMESMNNALSLTVRIVAAVIGFVVGGMGTGLVVRLIVVATSQKKLPGGLLYFFRFLGGIAAALIVFFVMSGRGGSGWGLGGGPGNGSGPGTGTGEKDSPVVRKDKDKPKERDQNNEKSSEQRPLEIEVLGNTPVEEIGGRSALDGERFYRARDKDGARLLTLAEVEKLISPEGEPKWRHILLVLYIEDGPDRDVKRVSELRHWAEKLRLKDPPGTVKVDTVTRAGKTPLK